MKRASIIKFIDDNKYVLYPIDTLKGGGGRASKPYHIEYDITYGKLASELKGILEHSYEDVISVLDSKTHKKEYLKGIGVKTMKELHTNSLNVGIFIKDEKYFISPSTNKGTRQGFHGKIDERIIIPITSTIEELGLALEKAFEKSK